MRYDLQPGQTFKEWEIVTIHHDCDRSVALLNTVKIGQNWLSFVTVTFTDQTYKFGEWCNGLYTVNHDVACKEYIERVMARMR